MRHLSALLLLLASGHAAPAQTELTVPSSAANFALAAVQRGGDNRIPTIPAAIGDAKTDCTAEFQRALDIAGRAGGGIVAVPAGHYRIDGTLSIPANVTLQGTYRWAPTATRNSVEALQGSVLLAYAGRNAPDGAPFIRLAGSNAVLSGVIVTYPEWKQSDVPPVPYPPCVESHDTENVAVQDCCFLNPYEAIKLVRAHRHLIRNITGYPSKRGIFVDECYDIGHIENVHFWPFGVAYSPEDPFCHWVNTQGVAFELARTDWHYVSNTFCFGYGVGYKFSESKTGSTNGNFLGLGADSCRRAVLIEQAQPPGLLITNGEFVGRWGSEDSICVEIGPNVVGKVSLTNCSFWGPINRCILMHSPVGQLTANACNFVNWDNHGENAPAIDIVAGRAIVQGCTFEQDDTDVRVGAAVVSAILTSNQSPGGFRVQNHAGARTQLLANQRDPVDWTPAALSHYSLYIGTPGDGRYIRDWHTAEYRGDGPSRRTARWSMGSSQLLLPVKPGDPYKLRMEIDVPERALSPDSGLYLDGRRIAQFGVGAQAVTASIPPARTSRVTLTLKCKSWIPREFNPASTDDRKLGITGYSVTMTSRRPAVKTFNANSGAWK